MGMQHGYILRYFCNSTLRYKKLGRVKEALPWKQFSLELSVVGFLFSSSVPGHLMKHSITVITDILSIQLLTLKL